MMFSLFVVAVAAFASPPGTGGAGGSMPRGWRPPVLSIAWMVGKWMLFLAVLALLVASIVGIPVAVVAIVVFFMTIEKQQAGRQYALLLTIAAAAERGMPLAPVLESFAKEQRGMMGRRARRAASLLRAGCPLPQTLAQVRGLVPRDAVAAIRVGAETGALAPSIRETTDSIQSFEPIWESLSGKFVYFFFVLLMMFLIVTFMMFKIAPAFSRIFDDFGVELPGMTQGLLQVSATAPLAGMLLIGPALVVGVLFFNAFVRYVGWGGWDMPGMGPMVRRFHTAPILHAVALVADRNLPFRNGIAALAEGYPRRSIRWRLHSVVKDVDSGADWADSLARHGLILQTERAVLQAAQRVGNLPWALREMAASSRRRLVYRLQGLLNVLFVAVILCFGLLVLVFAVGYFSPLLRLIRALAGW